MSNSIYEHNLSNIIKMDQVIIFSTQDTHIAIFRLLNAANDDNINKQISSLICIRIVFPNCDIQIIWLSMGLH